MGTWRRRALLAALAAVVASPALRPGTPDGYPLSTYPMFARDRGTEVAVATAVRVDPAGDRHRLDPQLIGGSDEVMLAAATVRRAVAGDGAAAADGAAADRLCAEIAARLAGRADAVAVELRTEVHDAVAFFDGDREPRRADLHARCPVER